jgi:outer membrane protein W
MKRFALFALTAALASPLAAQSSTLTLFVTQQQNSGSARIPDSDVRAEFDDPSAFGASIAHAFGSRFSGELAVFRATPNVTLRDSSGASATLGDLSLTEITLMARVHTRRDAPLGFYAGAGGAAVLTGDVFNREFGDVELDDEYTFAIGAGATWDFTPRIGLALDARYLPLTLHGRPVGEDVEIDADLNPLLISAGLRIRF